ncbi:hypothetical protein JNUCC1_02596 [Lentibacillus sp. JNUCC-1]|uniref:hypothetical protein n=1 Tax=Lentibacillus sp. JNUCC-1 TaxID=2654513 RepID=UPI0012E83790|nr:hypothetical protein [Lentibacillus sp. JNUCC-1]MUV38725.1 hypothetical protein [Lentibacillus sp. JNUCC-1]
MDVSIGGLIGVYGGMICGLIGWGYARIKLKKERGLDEVHVHIRTKAKSFAWYVTLVLIYFFLTLTMIGIEMSMAMVLSLLLLGHVGSWGITSVIMEVNLSREEPFKPPYVAGGIILICLSVLIFTVITIATHVWWYLLLGIPFAAGGLIITLMRPKHTESF